MMKLGSDKARPYTPITTVAAQMVLAVEAGVSLPGVSDCFIAYIWTHTGWSIEPCFDAQ
jgi:hypothetical protein